MLSVTALIFKSLAGNATPAITAILSITIIMALKPVLKMHSLALQISIYSTLPA
jgi:hypothetical protein